MSHNITENEAIHSLPDLLERVRDDGETFVIVRGEEEVGLLAPVPTGRHLTLQGLIDLVRSMERPDDRFADDLEEIQARQPMTDNSPWRS